MLRQLGRLERRFLEIESLLASPEVTSDPRAFRRLSIERSELEGTVVHVRDYRKVLSDVAETEALLEESSGELRELAFEELQGLRVRRDQLEAALHLSLLPKDPNDGRDVLLEVRAGAGGDEASLFAGEIFRMYQRYCERRRWKVEILSLSETELGGTKEIVALVQGGAGVGVYRSLKYESGVHRVQRVPATEAQGRVHTSTVTVAILPEADDVEVSINDTDLRIDTYRASGAGGQHVNRTDSAVRITHLPSGIVVACQDERSQIKNRSKAMKILQAKLLEQAQMEQERSLSAERKAQVGRGDRSERIRTYNFPQSRVTDHRINHTTHAIADFMTGDIQDMLDRLANHYQVEMLKEQQHSE
ncbi:MAG: peptide chain release factor 1 [Silvanigrellales bacterium]|nr:peptide chain release factor 1 [Silvanigrellales bacterium]